MKILEMCPKGCLVTTSHYHAIVTPEEVDRSIETSDLAWLLEYAVEIEWVDHVAAGAKVPTSIHGWTTLEHARTTYTRNLMERSIARQRILWRKAVYTEPYLYSDWSTPLTEDERAAHWEKHLASLLQSREEEVEAEPTPEPTPEPSPEPPASTIAYPRYAVDVVEGQEVLTLGWTDRDIAMRLITHNRMDPRILKQRLVCQIRAFGSHIPHPWVTTSDIERAALTSASSFWQDGPPPTLPLISSVPVQPDPEKSLEEKT